tara:strand:+ start:1381 stop:3009 length:1629 start_codon:yes stop_codon:yes gene_type:complete
MILKNSLNYINELFEYLFYQIKKIYLGSSFYDKKISKIDNNSLNYIPSLILFGAVVKVLEKKYNIREFNLKDIWKNDNLNSKDFNKLQNFYWLFSLNLKSSKKEVQDIVELWIDLNSNYNHKIWENDILSRRVISWIANSALTYEGSSQNYKNKFDYIIKKQINHLINEIKGTNNIENKTLSCCAIILTGLSFKDEKYLKFGLDLLKKIINSSLGTSNFPKSRNFRQLIFYLKHFILIREFLKESQRDIPEILDEAIFHLGQSYNIIWQSKKINFLFNGNNNSDTSEFDQYLKSHDYNFKNQNIETGGYSFFKNKKICLTIDTGSAPETKSSDNYQAGPLSFEITYEKDKIITNSGYFQNYKHQLHKISRSTANHSTLNINNTSSSRFTKKKYGKYYVEKNFKILSKNISSDGNFWKITASHDAYLKEFGIIHEREIEYLIDKEIFNGKDQIIVKKSLKPLTYELRFHLMPYSKVTKTLDGKNILIETENSGWKFSCKNHLIDIETGLYFGDKNSYSENKNILLFGKIENSSKNLEWALEKV